MTAICIFDPDGDHGPRRGTLEFFADKYRLHLVDRVAQGDYSPRRLKGTMAYVTSFLNHVQDGGRLGTLLTGQAKQIHLIDWLTSNYSRWTKGSTRADALGAVLGCFNWLDEHELLQPCPFRRPRKLRFPRAHRRAMRKQHYRAIYRAARKRPTSLAFRVIFFAAWHSGARLKEFRKLEPSWIDWDFKVIRIPAKGHKTGKVTGQERPVGLGPHLLSVLQRLVKGMAPGQKYVFLSPRGKPWTKDNLGRQYARYRAAAGVPEEIMMCAVRHGYAVRLLNLGKSNKKVADQLGHASTRMVDSIYGQETRYEAALMRELAEDAERGKARKRDRKPPEKPPDTPLFNFFS